MEASRGFRALYSSLHRQRAAQSKNADPLKAHLLPAPSQTHLSANILDTVLVGEGGQPLEWLFSSREGLVLRKKHANCTWKGEGCEVRPTTEKATVHGGTFSGLLSP